MLRIFVFKTENYRHHELPGGKFKMKLTHLSDPILLETPAIFVKKTSVSEFYPDFLYMKTPGFLKVIPYFH